jgi:hypothetical protein
MLQRRILLYSGIILLLLLGTFGFIWHSLSQQKSVIAVTPALTQTSGIPLSVVWKAPSSLTGEDKQAIQKAWLSKLLASDATSLIGHTITITGADQNGNWVYGSAIDTDSKNPEGLPMDFIAHSQNGAWSVWRPQDGITFCQQLDANTNVNSNNMKAYYCPKP